MPSLAIGMKVPRHPPGQMSSAGHCSKKCKVTKHIRGRNYTDLTKKILLFSFKWLFGTFKCCLLVITQLSEE